jgi:hypothetical protein
VSLIDRLRAAGWRGIYKLDASPADVAELRGQGWDVREFAAFNPQRGLHRRYRLAAA